MTASNFYDNSPLADAEIEMMQMLTREQCEAVAAWLKFYGYAFASQSPQCGRTIRTNFEYAANRLEILGKQGLPERN
ncbi:hypothetical protein [cf. Phormidesmis sp. LEGE 11477]|uniref:hypothetical protein n=1 Tax=cf. Phormidesmis sp. LEGE 11477 TaxID=1828680 RepID=UPI00188293F2|nr:hypothetical protein [cf. Phormidesmis sp. LEGE 11477]MBE9063197.1 hypothetical protein [cf. Phormidesmis sp. LEGE 11477]